MSQASPRLLQINHIMKHWQLHTHNSLWNISEKCLWKISHKCFEVANNLQCCVNEYNKTIIKLEGARQECISPPSEVI